MRQALSDWIAARRRLADPRPRKREKKVQGSRKKRGRREKGGKGKTEQGKAAGRPPSGCSFMRRIVRSRSSRWLWSCSDACQRAREKKERRLEKKKEKKKGAAAWRPSGGLTSRRRQGRLRRAARTGGRGGERRKRKREGKGRVRQLRRRGAIPSSLSPVQSAAMRSRFGPGKRKEEKKGEEGQEEEGEKKKEMRGWATERPHSTFQFVLLCPNLPQY